MAANSDKTDLTPKQRQMAEMLANPDFKGTITELCEICDVARSTFYKWMDKKYFRQYLNDLIDKYCDSELSRVWKALIRRCEIGDIQAIRLYFEQREKAALLKGPEEEENDGFLSALDEKAGGLDW